ncbi:MAG: hypothetical protein AB9891_03575 [Anaerolineaceae bacterium]
MSPNHNPSKRKTASPDTCSYSIEIRGRIVEADLAMICPPGFGILRQEPEGMAFSIVTDQSGLIGLLRHLHSRGVVFEAIRRNPFPLPSPCGDSGKGWG